MTVGKRHALVWGPFFILLVAFVLHVHQLYMMFAALSLLVPVSFVLGRRKLSGISVSRHGQSVMTAGERGRVTVNVENNGRIRQSFFSVRDNLPDGLESEDGGQVLVADLLPGQEARYHYPLVAMRRGVYQVGPPMLEGADFLGLFRFRRQVGPAAELLVYPRAIPVPNLWQRAAQGRTPHRARRRLIGPSSEMYGIREYVPGDDVRRIDWKTSARRASLYVVETEQTETMEAVVLLDLRAHDHAGSGDNSTLEYAATLAASLLSEALSRGCTVGLVAHGSLDWSVPATPDARQHVLVLEALARVRADGDQTLLQVLRGHERALPPGCSVAVISPATGPEAQAVADRLRALQHPATWFALSGASFRDGGHTVQTPQFAQATAGLAQRGALVVPVYGHVPLESSLWRRERVARRG